MTTLNIFANAAVLGTGPARPTRAMTQTAARRLTPVVSMQTMIEMEMERILAVPANAGESIARGFDAKEKALRELFDTLSSDERSALHASISNGSEAVGSFNRLAQERRSRLLTALVGRRCAI
jgi:type IV pilus biogenesis protein CpaD/CtpE